MSSGIPSLMILSEEQKFNGDNLLQWKTNITQLLGSKGLLGYIDGKIPKPVQSPQSTESESTTTTSSTATPIYSSTPTLDEWVFRDQLARGHITLNCTDVASLGVTTTGTAKDAWDSIQAEWGRSTDMRQSHAQEALNRTEYTEGANIQEHIKLLRTRKAAVDNLSTEAMSDETWRGVIIRSIPPSSKWLPVIPSLYAMATSADIISTLLAHGMILGRGSGKVPTGATTSNTVLAARTTEGCTNPNCKARKRSSHTSANCYWPGGGKEGQFPPNFGQRAKANVATSTSATASNTTSPTPSQAKHFVLLAQVHNAQTPGQTGVLIDNHPSDPSTPSAHASVALISKGFQNFQNGKTPTFLDSGASDMMFVSKDVFVEYKQVYARLGDSAKANDGGFEIVGEGNVVQRYKIDGTERNITYTRALHAPGLNANLISVSTLEKAGITVTFEKGQGIARKPDGSVVLAGKNISLAMSSNSLSQRVPLEQWHRCLAHCSPLTIKDMAKHNLVDGLTISEDSLNGKCEDCVMGRQTCRPFDGETDK